MKENIGPVATISANDTEAFASLFVKACYDNRLDLVRYFVDAGVSIQKNFKDVFQVCVKNNHLEIIKYLIEKEPALLEDRFKALQTSAENGNLDFLKLFVSKGCDFTKNDNYVLKSSGGFNRVNIVEYLIIEKNLDPNILLNSNYTKRDVLEWIKKYMQFQKLNNSLEEKIILPKHKI